MGPSPKSIQFSLPIATIRVMPKFDESKEDTGEKSGLIFFLLLLPHITSPHGEAKRHGYRQHQVDHDHVSSRPPAGGDSAIEIQSRL
jgi:hypothetical protein